MKNWRLIVFVIVIASFVTVFWKLFFSQLRNDQTLASAWVAVGTLGLALFTAILATVTWANIQNAVDTERRNRKERYLNEIIEWAIDFKKCLYDADVLRKTQVHVYAITSLRIAGVNAKGKKIETIAQKVFGADLLKHVKEVENSVAQYSNALAFAVGFDETELQLGEKSEIRDKVEQARPKGWKQIDKVLDEYTKPLLTSTTNLIEKCSDLITRL